MIELRQLDVRHFVIEAFRHLANRYTAKCGCIGFYNIYNNNNKSIYIAPWFQVTLFKGAVTSKKNSKKN